jgi:hypothetical protein
LADRIVAIAERAHERQENPLDKAMTYEYEDRRLGLLLGFFALLALLISGIIAVLAGQVAVGSGLLGAAVIGTVIGTFVHGRRAVKDDDEDEEQEPEEPEPSDGRPKKQGLLNRIRSHLGLGVTTT